MRTMLKMNLLHAADAVEGGHGEHLCTTVCKFCKSQPILQCWVPSTELFHMKIWNGIANLGIRDMHTWGKEDRERHI